MAQENAAYAGWHSLTPYQAHSAQWAQQTVSAPNYVPHGGYAQNQEQPTTWAEQAVSAPIYVPHRAYVQDQGHIVGEQDHATRIYANAHSQAKQIIIDAHAYAKQIVDESRIKAEAFQAAEVAAKNAMEETLKEMALVKRKIEIMKLNPEEYF
jgi:ATP-dependent exoDNAse (exonuclease V) alpha subunit